MSTHRDIDPPAVASLTTLLARLVVVGRDVIPEAVAALAERLPCPATVTVRRADGSAAGAVVGTAQSGEGVLVPRLRSTGSRGVVSLPLRVGVRVVGHLSIVAVTELDAASVEELEPFAHVIALALAAHFPAVEAGRLVLDEEAERAEIAATLHEGPVASLVAARYAIDSGADSVAVRRIVDHSLTELRRIVTPLRAHSGHGGLDRGLRRLVTEAADAGCTVSLVVTAGLGDALEPACAVAAYRVVAAALNGVAGPAHVAVEPADEEIVVTVTGASDPVDAGALDRWAVRVGALGGRLERHSDGVTLLLPTADATHPSTPRFLSSADAPGLPSPSAGAIR